MNNTLLLFYAQNSKDELEKCSKYLIKNILDCVSTKYVVSNIIIKTIYKNLVINGGIKSPLQAYYDAICQIGWDEVVAYDRIICISDKLMGPLYDLQEMLDLMHERNVDCWSITKQHKTPMNYLDYTGENLQEEYLHPEFIVFENHLINSGKLRSMLKESTEKQNERDSWIDNRALTFSKELSQNDFVFESYINTEDLGKIYYNPLLMCPRLLIAERGCPVFSRESFAGDYVNLFSNTTGSATLELMHYLEDESKYDVEMIWDAILKNSNQQDIYNNLHLNYILDSKTCNYEKTKSILKTHKIALVMHLHFIDLLDVSYKYAASFPEEGDIYITTNTEEKKGMIQAMFCSLKVRQIVVRVIENRGRDVSALLTGVKDVIMNYDYVCFVHDKKSAQLVPGSIGLDFGFQCFENTLGTKDFVNNVICTLHDQKRLGMLSPIYPMHGSYFAIHGNIDWAGNFEKTKQLANRLGITVPIEENKSPVTPLGTMFWFKAPALKILFEYDWEYQDFPEEPNGVDGTLLHAIERIYSYSVQQAGYYPAILCNEVFADIMLTNLAVSLQGINRSVEKYAAYFSYQQLLNVTDSMIYEIGLLREHNNILLEENEKLKREMRSLISETKLKKKIKNFLLKGKRFGGKNDS